MKSICLSLFAALMALAAGASPRVFDPADFGAVPDFSVDSTAAFQAAVDRAAADGGGRVVVSKAGEYKSYTVFLKSNVTFEIGSGVTLKGGEDGRAYPEFPPSELWNWNRTSRLNRRQMFYACGMTNVVLCGNGTIDGDGARFHELVDGRWRRKSDTEITGRTVFFVCCGDVRVEDVTIANPAGWSTWFLDCDRVVCDRVRVRANPDLPNGDGLHFGGCRDTVVRNCDIDAMDDALVLRSHQEAMKVPHAMERFLVTNCTFRSRRHSAIRIGWAHDYAIRDGLVVDCRFPESRLGLQFRMPEIRLRNGFWRDPPRYPGILEPLARETLPFSVENVVFRNLDIRSSGRPFEVFIGKGEKCAAIRGLRFENCRFTARLPPAFACEEEHHVEDWRFDGCTFRTAASQAEGWRNRKGFVLKNCKVYDSPAVPTERSALP